MYYSTTYPSLLGLLTLASDGMNLVGLWVEGQKYFGDPIKEAMAQRDDLPVFFASHRQRVPPGSMEHPMPDSLWRGDYLWFYRRTNGGKAGQKNHVQPSGRRRRGTQSHFHPHSLSPGGWHQWRPDWLCRGNREKDYAVKPGGCGYVTAVCTDEGDGPIGNQTEFRQDERYQSYAGEAFRYMVRKRQPFVYVFMIRV